MIIDAHAHVFAFPKITKYPNSTPFLSPEQQLRIMDDNGIDQAVILPLNSPETPAENQSIGEILYICRQHPGRFIPFCNLDPRVANEPDHLTPDDFFFWLEQYQQLGCKGLGELIAKVPFDDPRLLMLFTACERLGFPITFHTTTPGHNGYGLIDDLGFPRFENVLRNFPRLCFFGHSPAFWSEISGDVTLAQKNILPPGPVTPGGKLPQLLRQYPTLYGDLSAHSGFHALNRDPAHACEFLDEFQDQLLFGLDYCSVRNNMPHLHWLKRARDEKKISPQAFEKITWKNLNKVLNLRLDQ